MLHGMPGSIKEIRPCSRINQGPADNTLSDSLLILDDVWKPDVIQIFTVPVRILVTTQVKAKFKDVGVMEVVFDHFSLVDIRKFFYLQYETKCLLFFSGLALLSKRLYGCFPTTCTPQEYLPAEAKAIHDECKVIMYRDMDLMNLFLFHLYL